MEHEIEDLTLRLHETTAELHATCKQRDSLALENTRLRDLVAAPDDEDDSLQAVLELSDAVHKLESHGVTKVTAFERMAKVRRRAEGPVGATNSCVHTCPHPLRRRP